MFQQSKGESNIKTILNYAKKAKDGNPKDQKLVDFFNEVNAKYILSQGPSEPQSKHKEEIKLESSNYAFQGAPATPNHYGFSPSYENQEDAAKMFVS